MTVPLTFHLIPHTHWDREWYQSRAGFQARLIPMVGAALDLLEHEPDARFVADGQTILVEDAAAIAPAFGERVRDAVRRGQWDAGPWYVLADELIPSAESLVRNLALGARDAARYGARMNVCYSPDAFGHPAMLPAIAAQFGIGAGVVWRGLAPDERGDVDLRIWRAADGSEMLTYHLPPSGYEIGAELGGDDCLAHWGAIRDPLVARAATEHVAVFVGADHHLPPRALATMRDRIASVESGHAVRISLLSEYFAAVAGRRGGLGAVEGELRHPGHTWVLQGVHGTRCRMKREHARVERRLLRDTEPLLALAAWTRPPGHDHRAAILRQAWAALVQSQFHDTIAGTVADAVIDEQMVRLASVEAACDALDRDARHALLGHDPDRARRAGAHRVPTLAIWNPVPRRRGGIVTCEVTIFRRDVLVGPPDRRVASVGPAHTAIGLRDADGSVIPVQLLGRETGLERIDASRHYPDLDEVERHRIAFEVPAMQGFGFAAYTLATTHDEPQDRGLRVNGHSLSNAFVTVTVSPLGALAIVDHRTGETYHDAMMLEDECDCGDCYTPHIRVGAHAAAAIPLSIAASGGPLVGTIDVGWRIRSAGTGELLCHLSVVLHADSPVIRLSYSIDNCATDHRLRARLAVGAGDRAIAGSTFTAESRAPMTTAEHDPREHQVATAPAHRFVAAGAGARGLLVMHPGSFEYEWTTGADLLVTMVRSIGELSIDSLPERPGHAAWPTHTPGAQEPGMHRIEMALSPVDTGDLMRPDLLERIWAEAFAPIAGHFLRDFVGNMAVADELEVLLRGEGLVFSALKPADSGPGLIARCYNVTDRLVHGELCVSLAVGTATRVRLDESPIDALRVGADGVIAFSAAPRSIVSILLAPHH